MKQTWYLSFCDNDRPSGEQFLGGCYVDIDDEDIAAAEPVHAPEIAAAIQKAWLMGCNPGGEVASVRVDDMPPFADMDERGITPRNRLLSRKRN